MSVSIISLIQRRQSLCLERLRQNVSQQLLIRKFSALGSEAAIFSVSQHNRTLYLAKSQTATGDEAVINI